MSDKKKYNSLTTPNVQHLAPAYITEILIFRQEAKNDRRLPAYWWRGKTELAKRFKKTIFWVRAFLKVHSPEATIAALLSKEGKWIFSTAAPQLEELVEIHQAKIDRLSQIEVQPEVGEKENKVMPKFGKKNTLNKLRELDE